MPVDHDNWSTEFGAMVPDCIKDKKRPDQRLSSSTKFKCKAKQAKDALWYEDVHL